MTYTASEATRMAPPVLDPRRYGVLGRLGAVKGPVGVGVIARVAMPGVCRSRNGFSSSVSAEAR